MEISFIIVNYNSRHVLEKCIKSLQNNIKKTDIEIIVVNNDKEGLQEFSKKHVSPQKLSIVEVNNNIGFGSACNIGAKKAKGNLLCFLNPDAEIISKNIQDVINEMKNNSNIGVIGPKILDKDGNIQPWIIGKEFNLLNLFKNNLLFFKKKQIWESNEKQFVDWVAGTAFFLKKDIFEVTKGFDENFFLYFEDVDLCKRIRMIGKEIMYFPDLEVGHIGGESRDCERKQKKHYYASQNYYFQKHFGGCSSFLMKFFRKIYLWLKFVANKEK